MSNDIKHKNAYITLLLLYYEILSLHCGKIQKFRFVHNAGDDPACASQTGKDNGVFVGTFLFHYTQAIRSDIIPIFPLNFPSAHGSRKLPGVYQLRSAEYVAGLWCQCAPYCYVPSAKRWLSGGAGNYYLLQLKTPWLRICM